MLASGRCSAYHGHLPGRSAAGLLSRAADYLDPIYRTSASALEIPHEHVAPLDSVHEQTGARRNIARSVSNVELISVNLASGLIGVGDEHSGAARSRYVEVSRYRPARSHNHQKR